MKRIEKSFYWAILGIILTICAFVWGTILLPIGAIISFLMYHIISSIETARNEIINELRNLIGDVSNASLWNEITKKDENKKSE
jgi:phage-related protein